MNIIFLNIDGTLNCKETKARCGELVGIDSVMVKRLKEIVDATDAVLVLSSRWRLGYNKDGEQLENHAKYLKNKLDKQHLRILGMTQDLGDRVAEIRKWLENNDDVVENWVVLDDEPLTIDHLVQTNGGLQEAHVKKAIEILGGTYVEKEEGEIKEESKAS